MNWLKELGAILGIGKNLTDPEQYDIKKDKYQKAALKSAKKYMDWSKSLVDYCEGQEVHIKVLMRAIQKMEAYEKDFDKNVIAG